MTADDSLVQRLTWTAVEGGQLVKPPCWTKGALDMAPFFVLRVIFAEV